MTKRYLVAAFFFLAIMLTAAPKVHAQDAVVSYQTFYDELSPYGQWVSDPEYGNVWVPNEAAGYRPYATGGHWAMTEYGNMWVSDAPYGWACYHYGRWTYNPYYGWVWIPGHEWAPAWVSWRSGGGYYGWAPMGPGYNAGGVYDYPENYWVFVGPGYLYQPNVYTYYEPRRSGWYVSRTTYINETYVDNSYHTTYYYGPRREVIERETHQPVQVYRVSNARTSGESGVRGNEVTMYRPAVNRESEHTARPANVREAPQPIGRPQDITRRDERRQPEFRQEMQRQNPASEPSGNRGGFQRSESNQQSNQRQNMNQRPSNSRFENSNSAPNGQPMRNQQNYNQQENNNRPYRQQQQGPQMNRQQMPPQGQPQMNRQPQNQQQGNRPAPQGTKSQSRPQTQPSNENKRGRQ